MLFRSVTRIPSECPTNCLFLKSSVCLRLGSTEAHQVQGEVPGQTSECADGGSRQAGSVPSCESFRSDLPRHKRQFVLVSISNLLTRDCSALCVQELFDIILDENQLEDACEHMADYLEAYWKATHPPSSNPPNPLLNRTMATAALASSPEPVSNLQVQVLTSLRRNLELWPGLEGPVANEAKVAEHAL